MKNVSTERRFTKEVDAHCYFIAVFKLNGARRYPFSPGCSRERSGRSIQSACFRLLCFPRLPSLPPFRSSMVPLLNNAGSWEDGCRANFSSRRRTGISSVVSPLSRVPIFIRPKEYRGLTYDSESHLPLRLQHHPPCPERFLFNPDMAPGIVKAIWRNFATEPKASELPLVKRG